MRNLLLVVLGMMVLTAGCSVKTVPLASERVKQLEGASLTQSKRAKPSFMAGTAGKGMLGAIGAAAMFVAGNELVQENGVEDPAGYISSVLANELGQAYKLKSVSSTGTVVDSADLDEITRSCSGGDYILDVATVGWNFMYFPTDWTHYRVMYAARMRLIDAKNKEVVADHVCSRVPEFSEKSPTYDELLANKAQRLKDELKAAADSCTAEFKSAALNLPGSAQVAAK